MSDAERQRLYDRANAEYAQAKGHNQRVKERYPEAWSTSTITNAVLTDWVIEHKGTECPYGCRRASVEIDHKVPLSKGGPHSLDNLQMLCLPCNRGKHDLTDEEFRKQITEVGIPKEEVPKIDHSKLKDKLTSLFVETMDGDAVEYIGRPVFTLDHTDRDGYISMKRVYLTIGDPTEYKAAMALLGSIGHWRTLCKEEWFLEHIRGWREELKARLRSEAVGKLISISNSATSGALAAIKTLVTDDYLLTPYTEEMEKPKVGRPMNPPFQGEQIDPGILDDDFSRISKT